MTEHVPALASNGEATQRVRTLRGWEVEFAQWDALRTGRVSVAKQVAVATALRGESCTRKTLRVLRARPEYGQFVEAIRTGGLEAARAEFLARAEEYVLAHRDGLQMALDAKDHRAVPAFTVPALDRIVPKRDSPAIAQQVTIMLTPKQQAAIAGLDEPAPVIEYEVLPPEPAAGDEETTPW